MTTYLIIGNGAAGVTAAETIRQHDSQGVITILTAEPYPMYSRPGLAYVISGEIPPQQVIARTREWYADWRLELVHGRAQTLDVPDRMVTLADGRVLSYDKLLIATGARAVPAPYPGGDLDGVVYLDTLEGTKELLKKARRGKRGVVIGGGITALEMVEGFAQCGVDTHYFLRRDRLWSQVFNETESHLLAEKMHHHGVHIHTNTEATEILGNWRHKVRAVRLQNGAEFKCNLFGVAIGVKPQLELVKDTPLQTDRAILVNEYMQSSVPHIYAAGDCAQVYDRWSGKHLLDVLWPSAVAEGRAAALNMVGQTTPYDKGIPFNACLLFGLHITIIGQISPDPKAKDDFAEIQHLSRGASEVWFTFPRSYQSAWAKSGPHTLRLAVGDGNGDGRTIVGALIIGEQSLADPLRALIENQVDATPLLPYLQSDRETLTREIMTLSQNVKRKT
jgi:NAD(P)H-nitrite reductase large subunit